MLILYSDIGIENGAFTPMVLAFADVYPILG